MGKGNFQVLIEPWKEFTGWTNEVWVVRSDWLKKPENERALIDFLKANLIAFRRANTDFDWYLDSFRKYVTLKDADKMPAAHAAADLGEAAHRSPGMARRRQLLGGRVAGDAAGVQGGRCDSRHGQGRGHRRGPLHAAGAEGARLNGCIANRRRDSLPHQSGAGPKQRRAQSRAGPPARSMSRA